MLALTSVPTPFCLCEPFSSKACSGTSFTGKGVGTLVSSRERRALLALPLNRDSNSVQRRFNEWSTAAFVAPVVYMGFPLFVLMNRHSEQMFIAPWRVRGTVGFRADRNVGTLFCPASPRPAFCRALRRPDPPIVCPGFSLDK